MTKIGNYDWIVNFQQIMFLIENEIGRLNKFNRALVLGCGTSGLSSDLANRGIAEVTSVDIDEECINHMSQQNFLDNRLKWIVCDMNESENISKYNDKGLADLSFDISVDKGTFDAILVEGSISQYIVNIYKLLKENSIYVLISLHSKDFLDPFLSSELLNFKVSYLTPKITGLGCIAICMKKSNKYLDENSIFVLESQVMDLYFKVTQPLFTSEEIGDIVDKFKDEFLSLEQAYRIIFSSKTDLSYSYSFSLFLEDISNFQLSYEGKMNLSEALTFIKSME